MEFSDYMGVCRTLLDYGTLLDEGSYEQWFELFTAKGELMARGRTYAGREGLQEFVDGSDPSAPPARHFVGPPTVIPVGPAECTAHVQFMRIVRQADGTIAVASTGSYDDRLIKEGGTWKISERRHSNAANF